VTLVIVLVYLAVVLVVGSLSHRFLQVTGEGYFVADRSIGPFVLLMTLFGTHMTSFALLGASAQSYRTGIGVFSLMASSSALVVPLVFFVVGTRVWALGKQHGFVTQVQYFRERFQSETLGVMLFVVLVSLLIPYLLIGVLGGGITLEQITDGQVPSWVGGLLVSSVVLVYVWIGGMRGTAWVNTLQTLVFMTLGAITMVVIFRSLGGLTAALDAVERTRPELLREVGAFRPVQLVTYTLIPLSVGMFPHIFAHWLSARSAGAFRVPIVFYPLCILAVWVPSVLLGVVGTLDCPDLQGPASNSVLVRLIALRAPDVLAGFLGAGVFAAIMSSLDSQSLSLGTLFTKDVVERYFYPDGLAEEKRVFFGRLFVAAVLGLTYFLSLVATPSMFGLAIWSFSGYAALVPVVLAALFWRRSTAWGAIAAVGTVAALWIYFFSVGFGRPDYSVGGTGVMPVAVLFAASSLVLVVVSLFTRPPALAVVDRYVPERGGRR
jgi:SSS family solute:Na+ symporter